MSNLTTPDLERLCKRRGLRGIVAFGVGTDGSVQCIIYGKTPLYLRALDWWAGLVRAKTITTAPFRTVFGTGNSGVPKPLNPEELGALDPAALAQLPKELR